MCRGTSINIFLLHQTIKLQWPFYILFVFLHLSTGASISLNIYRAGKIEYIIWHIIIFSNMISWYKHDVIVHGEFKVIKIKGLWRVARHIAKRINAPSCPGVHMIARCTVMSCFKEIVTIDDSHLHQPCNNHYSWIHNRTNTNTRKKRKLFWDTVTVYYLIQRSRAYKLMSIRDIDIFKTD